MCCRDLQNVEFKECLSPQRGVSPLYLPPLRGAKEFACSVMISKLNLLTMKRKGLLKKYDIVAILTNKVTENYLYPPL